MTRDELILDRYEPIGVAGTGGFGTVQIAWDPRIQRKVAIKTIKLTALDAKRAALPGAEAVANLDTSERWHGVEPWNEFLAGEQGEPQQPHQPQQLRNRGENMQVTALAHLPGLDEARTAAMLSDSRIVTVYDFEVRGRMAYLIMEYVEGITLTRLLAEYPDYITLDIIAAVFDSVAGALEAAHGASVLHLDIKPDNILITPQGQVKVTDFGLATLADASGTGTTGGGTIGYMPLEQMRREHLDVRTDEWSLAAVAYEMLTGANPFRVPTLEEAESAIEEAELILPSLCWERLDEQVDDVVFYALDPDRDERYETVGDFAEEMDKFLGDADEGAYQLSLIVSDALDFDDEEGDEDDGVEDWREEDPEYDSWEDDPESEPGGLRARLIDRVFDRMAEYVAAGKSGDDDERGGARWARGVLADGNYDDEYDEDSYYDDEPAERADSTGGKRDRHDHARRAGRSGMAMPLGERVPPHVVSAAARAFAALASAFVSFIALSNMPQIATFLGSSAAYVAAVGAAIVGVVAFAWASVGALAAFSLFGIAAVLVGQPVLGAVVLVATVIWWYVFGHEGKASANTSLLMACAGAVGASSVVPLVAGASMRPTQAVATTVYGLVLAFAFSVLCGGSLLGWDVQSAGRFVQMSGNIDPISPLTTASTYIVAVSWIAAAAVLSFLREHGNRTLAIAGIVFAAVLMLAAPFAFITLPLQTIAFVIIAAVALVLVVP